MAAVVGIELRDRLDPGDRLGRLTENRGRRAHEIWIAGLTDWW
jgi:hypothetical protein